MEITWDHIITTNDRFGSYRLQITESFWRKRKTVKEITGAKYSKKERFLMLPYLSGKIKVEDKTLLVRLYILPRSKFNLMLGTFMEYGEHAETALTFTDRDFTISKSTPSMLKKVIKKHQKEIDAEIEKRFNNEWFYLDKEEKKKIVWEDRGW